MARVEADLKVLREVGADLVHIQDDRYPPWLRQIPDPPVVLFVRGDARCLGQRQLAIVGSRNASPAGRETARELAFSASKAGLIVTSGLARGIDRAAHEGALAADGKTVAVMGTGPERIYPAGNRDLAEHIISSGALVTEFTPATRPIRSNFPRRNRIISGLSLGTLVVEAAHRSGSLITARLSGEQGREVLAVPGSIHNPLTRGCHRLIRDGARLVESISDVLEELGFLSLEATPPARAEAPQGTLPENPQALAVLNEFGFDPATPDQLVSRSGLTADSVCSILFSLELQGYIQPVPGGAFVRSSKRLPDERKRP